MQLFSHYDARNRTPYTPDTRTRTRRTRNEFVALDRRLALCDRRVKQAQQAQQALHVQARIEHAKFVMALTHAGMALFVALLYLLA